MSFFCCIIVFHVNYIKLFLSCLKINFSYTDETFNLKALQTKESEVPQLIGMGLRDALTILENQKIGVKVIGRGVIKKQSLTAGTKVFKGSTITIELS